MVFFFFSRYYKSSYIYHPCHPIVNFFLYFLFFVCQLILKYRKVFNYKTLHITQNRRNAIETVFWPQKFLLQVHISVYSLEPASYNTVTNGLITVVRIVIDNEMSIFWSNPARFELHKLILTQINIDSNLWLLIIYQ
jgi:hypothetical protein